jgi:hypothetical protein
VTTLVTLCGVVSAGLVIGVCLTRTITALIAVAAAGAAGMILIFVEYVVLPNPKGDGWDGRYQVSGHWVPIWQCNLIEFSVIAWLASIGAAAWLSRLVQAQRLSFRRHF